MMVSFKQISSALVVTLLLIATITMIISNTNDRTKDNSSIRHAMETALLSARKTRVRPFQCKRKDIPKAITLITKMCEDQYCTSACRVPQTSTHTEKSCVDGSCIQYQTPLNECYNPQTLFPDDDNPWGDYDILDKYVMCSSLSHYYVKKQELQTSKFFKRTFYATKDSSCINETDSFDAIPLDVCIGPFGEPRPFGIFSLIDSNSDRNMPVHTNVPIS